LVSNSSSGHIECTCTFLRNILFKQLLHLIDVFIFYNLHFSFPAHKYHHAICGPGDELSFHKGMCGSFAGMFHLIDLLAVLVLLIDCVPRLTSLGRTCVVW